jgi:hypothetical protein
MPPEYLLLLSELEQTPNSDAWNYVVNRQHHWVEEIPLMSIANVDSQPQATAKSGGALEGPGTGPAMTWVRIPTSINCQTDTQPGEPGTR